MEEMHEIVAAAVPWLGILFMGQGSLRQRHRSGSGLFQICTR